MPHPACQIVLVKPAGFEFGEGFREVMEALQEGLGQQGMAAPIRVNRIDAGATPILFGAHHLAAHEAARLPGDSVIYNLEQLAPGYPWYRDAYLALLARHQVWDYSARNVGRLLALNAGCRVRHVPAGYSPCLSRIAAAPAEDVDVLFYGLATPRRQGVLDLLAQAGLRVTALCNVWGSERDAWIARAKVVLNLHAFETGDFEMVRVLYLLANRKAVVAEMGDAGEIDADLRGGMRTAAYDGIVDACLELVRRPDMRAALVAAGYEAITRPGRAMAAGLPPIFGTAAAATCPLGADGFLS